MGILCDNSELKGDVPPLFCVGKYITERYQVDWEDIYSQFCNKQCFTKNDLCSLENTLLSISKNIFSECECELVSENSEDGDGTEIDDHEGLSDLEDEDGEGDSEDEEGEEEGGDGDTYDIEFTSGVSTKNMNTSVINEDNFSGPLRYVIQLSLKTECEVQTPSKSKTKAKSKCQSVLSSCTDSLVSGVKSPLVKVSQAKGNKVSESDPHITRYLPLLLALQTVAGNKSAEAIFKQTDLSNVDVDVFGRYISLSATPLLNGVTAGLGPSNPVKHCVGGSIARVLVPSVCTCIREGFIGAVDAEGERVFGVSVFPKDNSLMVKTPTQHFMYFYDTGRTMICLSAESEDESECEADEDEDSGATGDEDQEEDTDEDTEQKNGDTEVDEVQDGVDGDEDEEEDEDGEGSSGGVGRCLIVERNVDGAIDYVGLGVDGVKHGLGALVTKNDNAVFVGNWVEGKFSGSKNSSMVCSGDGSVRMYYTGVWKNGVNVHSHPLMCVCEARTDTTNTFANMQTVVCQDYCVCRDVSTSDCISAYPLQQDSWEAYWTRVDRSTINLICEDDLCPCDEDVDSQHDSQRDTKRRKLNDGLVVGSVTIDGEENAVTVLATLECGEGLFANRNIPAGTVVSWYNGIREDSKAVDERDWELNSNTMTLVEGSKESIDVPCPYDSTEHYVASLGHKANHHFIKSKRNAEYCLVNHCRFGYIKAVMAVKDIKKDEEVCVDYGYNVNEAPDWFLEGIKVTKTNPVVEDNQEHVKYIPQSLQDCDLRYLPLTTALAIVLAGSLEKESGEDVSEEHYVKSPRHVVPSSEPHDDA